MTRRAGALRVTSCSNDAAQVQRPDIMAEKYYGSRLTPGNWMVTRFCCTSGMCIECRAAANGTTRKRVVQIGNLSEASAKWVASNWSNYDAKAVEQDIRRLPAHPTE